MVQPFQHAVHEDEEEQQSFYGDAFGYKLSYRDSNPHLFARTLAHANALKHTTHTHTHTHTYIYIIIYMTHTHTYTHAHIHTYTTHAYTTHTRTHTHTHMRYFY